jgi:hypothetical protein
MLKGFDMIIWEAFSRLGLEASVKPVLDIEFAWGKEERMVIANDLKFQLERGSCRTEDYEEIVNDIRTWGTGDTINHNQVYWLTEPTHRQIQMAYIAVSIKSNSTFALFIECNTDLTSPPSTAIRKAWIPFIPTVPSLPRSSQTALARTEQANQKAPGDS